MSIGRWLMTIGGLLQLAGVAVVFWEISGIQRTLGLAPWWRTAITDFAAVVARNFGHSRRTTVGASVNFATRYALTGRARVTPAEGKTVAERLDGHRRQLDALRSELDELWKAVDQGGRERQAAIAALDSRLTGEIRAAHQLVKELSGGFLRVRALGGGMIIIGTALITLGVWA